ncbi:MAG TPA: hypothetical protein GXX48_06520 [Ochrobactrum intermedium]|uniref:Uncharacterized protein n=1 Tax=Brucella intermedia TaxID=94625 RepID=A0A7V6TZ21_9HYPH|nr:hypothetical protein [Brucella intermedia]HHV67282.1 hypothetical protein [Brucella intermedia]
MTRRIPIHSDAALYARNATCRGMQSIMPEMRRSLVGANRLKSILRTILIIQLDCPLQRSSPPVIDRLISPSPPGAGFSLSAVSIACRVIAASGSENPNSRRHPFSPTNAYLAVLQHGSAFSYPSPGCINNICASIARAPFPDASSSNPVPRQFFRLQLTPYPVPYQGFSIRARCAFLAFVCGLNAGT